jgi:mono/diheme cytochrome c family protein
MKSIMKWTGIALGGLIGLAMLAGLALYPTGMKKLTQSYPDIHVEKVNIPTSSEAIDHGRHIAIIWACTKCHGENLSGMLLADDPFLGTIPASNLTSGKGGIATSYTDADWMRAIRHGVKPDSQGEIFMYNYSAMSDQDLGDLIAYLKQAPPVDTDYPAPRYGPIIAIAPAIGLFTPAAELIHEGTPHPADPVPGATIEYGRYLSSICFECHSNSLAGKLGKWTQEDFIRAVRTGVLPNGRQIGPAMSPKTFGEMNDMELIALWLYLQSLPPVNSQQ